MILADRAKWSTISHLEEVAGIEAPKGTTVVGLTKALQESGIKSAIWALKASIDDLVEATKNGNAVIARLNIADGHFFCS